jgi:hypothetical protein
MKKLLLLAGMVAAIFNQPLFSQDAVASSSLSPILVSYYQVKDALIAGDANVAATKAGEMLKAINDVDMKKMPAKEHSVFMPLQSKLAFDARHISEKKVLGHQREHFAALSSNMYSLAKAVNLSPTPVYKDYCPMQKAYWLSADQAIRNPYYGDAMLTCGKVSETITH